MYLQSFADVVHGSYKTHKFNDVIHEGMKK